MSNLYVYLIRSRNKDNKDVPNFKQRDKTILEYKENEDKIIEEFKSFATKGVPGEQTRLYRSVNSRNEEKIREEFIIRLLRDKPSMTQLNRTLASVAQQVQNRDESKWLFDFDVEIEEKPDLVKVDIERRNQQMVLASKNKELEGLRKELAKLKQQISLTKQDIEQKISEKNQIEVSLNPINSALEQNDAKRLEKARQDRDEALLAYNTSKEEENVMKKEVEAKLVNNFRDFSNIFCRYAKSFFGGNHVVKLSLPFITDESIDETMIRFSLDGKERTESFMLSESQRIFTDLAFRFAILTSFHEQSFFMCETPDSTLDLLHETNAVNTFKEYINMGNMLILTANARKSNLVSELYNSYDEKDKNVIDLTELSKLALEERISFYDYVGGKL